MQIPSENKSLRSDKQTVCSVCRGNKCVKQSGKTVTCPRCRGTGTAGGYSTKGGRK